VKLDGWLLAVCAARTCLTSVFMTYAAALPVLRTEWGMSATAAGSISTGFQAGYAVSLVAFSSLADRVGARRLEHLRYVLQAHRPAGLVGGEAHGLIMKGARGKEQGAEVRGTRYEVRSER